MSNYRTLMKRQNISKENTVALQKRHNLPHCAGPWPVSTEHCSIPCSTHGGKSGITDGQATPTPMPSTAVPQPPVAGTVATQTQATGASAEPENQPVSGSVALTQKKNYTKKSVCLVKDDDDPASSQELEEEAEPAVTSLTGHLPPSMSQCTDKALAVFLIQQCLQPAG